MDSSDKINPWALFKVDVNATRKIGDNIIDNRFPNNFRKYSSLVTCNFCNVILLKYQTQQHFKIHHNKKFKKKFSRFKIPFNAVEGYDLICEIRRKKLVTSNISRTNKTKELFKLKHKHSDNTFTIQSSKAPLKLVKKPQKEVKPLQTQEHMSPKINIVSEQSSPSKNESIQPCNDENIKTLKKFLSDQKIEPKVESRKKSKRSILASLDNSNKRLKSADLKLNIRLNSDGLLTSSIKSDVKAGSNIFDRISNFCDNTTSSKGSSSQTVTPSRGIIKQSGFDESYGCAIFTDEFNNSILIDNDKDEPDDFDCCESSLSNDSAYFSLPNTTVNSSTSNCKYSNLCDFSVAPPLVTAYQYTNSTNKVSYGSNECQIKGGHSKSTPMTMHVTRSLSYNSIVPPKSTVKHRFYVSGHSNQTIINTLRRKCNTSSDINFLIDNENEPGIAGFQSNGILQSLSHECQDPSYFKHNKSTYQNQKHPVTSKAYTNGIKDISENRFWKYFEENGLNVNVLIPKRLRWNQCKSRVKSVPQLNIVKSKQSPKNIVPKQQFNRSMIPPPISDNPLLTSYTIDANGVDDVFKSDPLLTSEIVFDYQFPDRNQMSFQQRLLERGVISQRDIARSQRCLSFNINSNNRKNSKMNSVKPNVIDYNRISVGKNYPIKTQVVCRTGYNSTTSTSGDFSKMKHTVIHHSPPIISHDIKINSVPKQPMTHRKQAWCDDRNLSRIQNVSMFQGQCLSQNTKYFNQNPKMSINSPCPNRNPGMSNFPKTMDNRNNADVFQSASSNSSILHSNNTSFNTILTAQNNFPNDSNRFSQKQLEGRYVHLAANNVNRRYNKVDNEFMNFQQSYNEINPSSLTSQPNYQTIYNPQLKFANHSTTIYNANFQL